MELAKVKDQFKYGVSTIRVSGRIKHLPRELGS